MTPIEDDGVAVHYTAVKRGTPVISSDGQEVATVVKVLDNYREHIFDGLVIRGHAGRERLRQAAVRRASPPLSARASSARR